MIEHINLCERTYFMKKMKTVFTLLVVGILAIGCTSEQQIKDQVKKALEEDPKLLISAIEKNPVEFAEAMRTAIGKAQSVLKKKQEEDEAKKLEETFDNPLKPEIRSDEMIRGNKNAPLTLVEYSDYECPFCSRGFNTVMDLISKYGDNIRFVYKHLPLSFHKNAMIASQYHEAIRLQDEKKAWKFHDEIFKNQGKLKSGEPFLKKLAKEIGANMTKLAKDVNSEAVKKRIQDDMKEAASFGMQGTPGFLLNGIPVKGAYPASYFYGIVEKLKAKGKVKF